MLILHRPIVCPRSVKMTIRAISTTVLLTLITLNSFSQGNCLSFDGSSDYLSTGTLNPVQFTAEAWINPNVVNADQPFISTLNEGGLTGYELHISPNGRVAFTLRNGSAWLDVVSPDFTIIAGTWFHIAGTYDGITAKIYVNGVKVAQSVSSFTAGSSIMTLGRRSSGLLYFNGKIDECHIWNSALPVTTIQSNMFTSPAGTEPGLLASYNFNQGVAGGSNSGVTTLNSSTGSYNGTLSTFALSGASSNWVASTMPASLPNNSLSFDGTSDYVSVPALGSGLTKFTIETWINPSALATSANFNGIFNTVSWSTGDVHFQINNSKVELAVNGSTIADVNYTFALNTWYHLAATYNSTTKQIYIYVNGSLVQMVVLATTVSANFTTGQIGGYGASRYFAGKIDEYRIWNTERTQTEIRNNMFSILNGTETGLLACYSLNQGSAAGTNTSILTAINSVGANHGTLNTFTLTGSTSNWVSNTLKSAPSNHATAFTATASTNNITLTWADATTGTTLPDGYIIMASTTNSFTDPANLTDITVDADMSDGTGKVKVGQGVQTFSGFTNLQYQNNYYFRIYPYTNYGTITLYKTTATVPSISVYYPKPEPTNHASAFTSSTDGTSITLNWTDATGSILPDGYIIAASSTNTFSDPVDLNDITTDANLSDGSGVVKVLQGVHTYSGFTNMSSETAYYFRLYPYTNSGTYINYKTTVTVPNTSVLFIKAEPTNHVTGFASTYQGTALNLSWTDATGVIQPDGYLILATTTTFSDPVDNTEKVIDNDLSDGTGAVKIVKGVQSFSGWTNANPDLIYYFQIYPYTNSGNFINYKTTALVPKVKATKKVSFTEQTGIVLTGITYSEVSWADFDADGDLDLFLMGSTGSEIVSILYSNNGSSSFTKINLPSVQPVLDGNLATGDYNNDGYPDLLISGNYNDVLSSTVYKNNGNNTFTAQSSISLTGVYQSSADWGDYDNDGDLDILIAGSTSTVYEKYNPVTQIYKNNGDNTFTQQTGIVLPGLRVGSVKFGDCDNDGDPDLLLNGDNGSYNPMTKIFKNNGNNTFSELTGTSFESVSSGSVNWVDYDNDGDLDVFVIGSNTNYQNYAKIYRNNGNSTFTEQTSISLSGSWRGNPIWFDYDNDGDLDILINGYTQSGDITKLFKNNGNNSFTEQTDITLPVTSNGTISYTDYDGDRDLDILITGSYNSSAITRIFSNDCQTVLPQLAAPTGISHTVNEAEVTLKWNKLVSSVTPAKALTYNLQVGTLSNSQDITSPQSLSDGRRLILSMGNGQLDTSYVLKRLKKGNYFWKVQGIDNCFMGGAFSAEGTFSITQPGQAYSVVSESIGADNAIIKWSRGNLGKCIVFGKENAVTPAYPANNTTYTASEVFGAGTQIGSTGWYCHYDGTGTQVHITGLKSSTSYTIAVYEYDGTPSAEQYFTSLSADNQNTFTSDLFTEITGLGLPGIVNGSVLWCDYDNDGDLDFLQAGSGMTMIYRNEGNNSFVPQNSIVLNGLTDGSAAWGDYNNDNNPDIILTGVTGTYLYRNNGNNTFTEQTGINIPGGFLSVVFGDSDNDGDQDILLSGSGAPVLFRNNGDNTFTEIKGNDFESLTFSSVIWGDIDNDGDLDIFHFGQSGGFSLLKIYRNDGDNKFVWQSDIKTSGYQKNIIALGDYDNDGDLDILLGSDYASTIFSNNNNGTFTKEVGIVLSGGYPAWGDYDNDGFLDILICGSLNSSNWTSIYRNNGDNYFEKVSGINLPGLTNGSLSWGDYDNDGDLDIIMAGENGVPVTKIYRNDGNKFNIKPQAPVSISSKVNNSDAVLKWSSVKTDNTPASTITYNLKIGTSSVATNISSPLSSETGYRKIVSMGNGQLDTTYNLKKLRKGTYYWSVQAVDNSFTGSPFSPEGTFTISASTQAFGLNVKTSCSTAFLQWTRGYSDKCIVVIREGTGANAVLSDNTTYNASTSFGNGAQIGTSGWYTVYNGTGDTVTIRGLKSFTSYTFMVVEYDGAPGSEKYLSLTGDGNPASFTTDLFTEQTGLNFVSAWMGNLACGDYDKDGFQDLIITGNGEPKLYHNNGNRTYTEETGTSFTGVYGSTVAWGDYDNDGYLDILLTGSNKSKVYKNNGDRTFTDQTQISLMGINYGAASWIDYDNDGDLDILLSLNSKTRVYRNNGNNTFTEQSRISEQINSSGISISCADYDNDGYTDILFAGSGATSLYHNDGGNTFTIQNNAGIPGFSSGSAAWGDYDNDGYLDILITGNTGSVIMTKIYHNNRNRTFSEVNVNNISGVQNSTTSWGDIDNDGDLDFFITGELSSVKVAEVYLNNGDNTFSEKIYNYPMTGVSNGSSALCDFDNDGDLDIIYTGGTSSSSSDVITRLYRNELTISNVIPAAPSGLQQTVTTADATLSWNRLRTDLAHQKGLSYNVRVGTTTSGQNIVAPNLSSNGLRSVSSIGNAFTDTVFKLKNLKKGIYYWSVQAVDNTLASGPFSQEGIFTITQTAQAFGVSATKTTDKAALIQWTRTNLAKCIVFIKQGNPDNTYPENNVTYTASTTFGSGTQIGTTGWYCVYNGIDEAVSITGLTQSTGYSVKVLEYDGAAGGETYLDETAQSNPLYFETNLFAEQTGLSLTVDWGGSVYCVDYDKDGFLDIFSVNQSSAKIDHNNGDNTFTSSSLFSGMQYTSASWADYNNDGNLDVLITGRTLVGVHSKTILYRSNGDGTFTEQSQMALRNFSSGISAWGDYDNDGDLDLLLGGRDENNIDITSIYRNNGDNTFTEQSQIILAGIESNSNLKWIDFDIDGDLDIFVMGYSNSSYVGKLYRNNGNNTFTDLLDLILPQIYGGTCAWGDYDNDGDPDILLTGTTFSTQMPVTIIYRNDGNTLFTEQKQINLPGMKEGSAAWGDYNNDGNLDLIIAGSGPTRIFKNNGNNTFTEQIWSTLKNVTNSSKVMWADYDNDGDLDVLLFGDNIDEGIILNIFKNQTIVSNSKPGKPLNLTASTSSNITSFSWDKPVETDETPANGLTYNVRIGTTSGGNQILSSPPAANGRQLFAEQGLLNNSRTLRMNLKPGKYYWSVRTVDNGFYAGDFSAEKITTIDSLQTSDISYKSLNNTEILLKWKRGNGDRCIVLAKRGIDNTGAILTKHQSYVSDPTFELGDQVGHTGWYCIYNGRADSTSLKGLTPNSKYTVNIIEYIGNNGTETYFTESGPANIKVLSPGLFVSQEEVFDQSIDQVAAEWGDYDNDGDLDIILNGNASTYVFATLSNNRNNSFSYTNQTTGYMSGSGSLYNSIAGADYDNDGDMDYLLNSAYYDGSVSTFYRNNNNSTFSEQARLVFPPVAQAAEAWCDYDNDGDLDLVISGTTSMNLMDQTADPLTGTMTKIFKNNGNKTFSEQTNISLPGVYAGSVAWGDYDNDGRPDILLTGSSTSGYISKIFRNSGNNNFAELTGVNLTGVVRGSGSWGDYDNDGDLDILITGMNNLEVPVSKIYRNDGNKTFIELTGVQLTGVYSSSAAWGDYNNDGKLDILISGASTTRSSLNPITKVYKNNGNDTFTDEGFAITGVSSCTARWGDYDNDGDLDILLTGTSQLSNFFTVYRNTTISKDGIFAINKTPQKPIGLNVAQTPEQIVVSWDPVTTDETPSKSMSYNFTLYRKLSNGVDSLVISPESSSTGYRRKNSIGNTQLNNFSIIKNLPVGKYGWRAQAVDGGFAGGTWSDESLFEIKNTQAYFSSADHCSGYPTTFTNLSTSTETITEYKWYFGDNTTSTLKNPSHSFTEGKTYVVSLVVTDSQGVKDSVAMPVVIKQSPKANFEVPAVCQGVASVLTNSSNIYNLTISSWLWNFGDVQTSAVLQPAPHGYLLSGEYPVKLTITANNGCFDTITKIAVVGSYPVAAVTTNAPLSFCEGDSVILSVPNNIKYQYNWIVDGVQLTTANKNTFVPKYSGEFSVKVTSSSGNCATTSAPAKVTIKKMPLKPVVDPGIYQAGKCPGESPIKLSISNAETTSSYQWYKNGVQISGANSTFYQEFLQQGIYKVEASLGDCSVQSEALNVVFDDAPIKPDLIAKGPTVWILSCKTKDATSYKWYLNGSVIPGANTYQYVANNKLGTYNVSVSNAKGCFTISDAVTIPTGITGIEDVDPFRDMILYPNPTSGLFSIIMENQLQGSVLILVLDQSGKEIRTIKTEKISDHFEKHIDLSGQSKGIYVIKTLIDKKTDIRKVIVK